MRNSIKIFSSSFFKVFIGVLFIVIFLFSIIANIEKIRVKLALSQGSSGSSGSCPLIDSYAVWFNDESGQKYLRGSIPTKFYVSNSYRGPLYGFGGPATEYRMSVYGNIYVVTSSNPTGVYAQQFCLIDRNGNPPDCKSGNWGGGPPEEGGPPGSGGNNYWNLRSNQLTPSLTVWNVGIGTSTVPSDFKLYVNGKTSVTELCFNGTNCRSDWGSASGTNYWVFNSSTKSLYPSSTSWNIGIGTTSPSSLYKLHVVGNVNVQGNLCLNGSCRSDWPDKDIVVTLFDLVNGLYYTATSNWVPIYPVTNTPFIRDSNYDNLPYLSAKNLIEKYVPAGSTTTITPWFDLAYGFYNINAQQNKAIFLEEGDNSAPFSFVSLFSDPLDPNNYVFASAHYYDSNGVFRTTLTTSSISGLGFCRHNQFINCVRSKVYADRTKNLQGYLKLELRALPWQLPPGKTEGQYCTTTYVDNLKVAKWATPLMLSLSIGKFKSPPTSSDPCSGAALNVKIQGRLVNDQWPSGSGISPSPLRNILNELNGDIVFVIKRLGIAYTTRITQ